MCTSWNSSFKVLKPAKIKKNKHFIKSCPCLIFTLSRIATYDTVFHSKIYITLRMNDQAFVSHFVYTFVCTRFSSLQFLLESCTEIIKYDLHSLRFYLGRINFIISVHDCNKNFKLLNLVQTKCETKA